jgi:hypothetical protein
MFRLATRKKRSKAENALMHELLTRFNTSYEDAASSGFVEDNSTRYSNEGTEAHDWAEKVLTGQLELSAVPENFREPVGIYVFECRKIAEEDDGFEPFVEAQVPLFYNKEDTGTMDYAVASQRRVRVRDYKHGVGIYVKVLENTQLAIYALSFMQMLEDDGFYSFDPDTEVEIGCIQPRHREWREDDYWVLTYADLKAFCKQHIQKPHDIIDEGIDTAFAPDYKACQFCKMKAFCTVRLHHMAQGLPTDEYRNEAALLEDLPTYEERGSQGKFEEAHPDELERIGIYAESFGGVIPLEQMVKIYSNRKGITAFLNDIEKHLTRLALSGTPAPGTKLVIGRQGNTAWADEKAAEKLLEAQGLDEDQYIVRKPVSPSEAARLLGDLINKKKKKNPLFDAELTEEYEGLTTRSPGKKTLALESDPRPSVESSLEGFDDLDALDEEPED